MRHFLGQQSTQALHWMHCILWMTHLPSALSIAMALVGQALSHIPQAIQLSPSIETDPLVLSSHSLGTTGYIRVAGFLPMLPSMVLPNRKNPSLAVMTALNRRAAMTIAILATIITTLTYLSVQLMQGSIVSTRIGTSAKSAPASILTNAGILMLVGVLTLILFRNLVPWPFA